ncbi:hypothetical protein CLAFUW4_10475 [Fulvia fulva]|uniref:Uncharacterized protein n=1 Tax=Passalora fulva TaxID=5499 RepID=A0A9Q8P874_PASFU|nr:uncharacterized protein CLAFUR5_05090 [Fulvia fulva]KAK4616187.1 hypothetical protein CLAFUR4_10478 [Fulvia fulva]KAK4616654.1 hypothetical protein CLAFUR0_10480 [Fulvia fulva]UJO16667.1 hypothetical protein CLAFUR5_05090 [Fulvia fulva]WPV19631.1 hypothetical protein CLAFUW4_10475 [Fulvia fulva]WPV34666.1 hypothetical protein CLAFUW7_10475 [Fulvia fulva]
MAKTKKPKKARLTPKANVPPTPGSSVTDTRVDKLAVAVGNLTIKNKLDFSKALIKYRPPKLAAPAVFGTYELVEQILLSMPKPRSKTTMKTILLSQRVSKTFRGVVERSKAVRKVLFFEACDDFDKMRDYVTWNPLLRVTESLEERTVRKSHLTSSDGDGYLSINNVLFLGPERLSKAHGTKGHQSESWQKMLLAQDEVEPAYINTCTKVNGRSLSLARTLDAEHTMGRVADLLRLKFEGVKVREYYDGDDEDTAQYLAEIEGRQAMDAEEDDDGEDDEAYNE